MNQPQSIPSSTTAAEVPQSTEWGRLAARLAPALTYVLKSNGVPDFLGMKDEALTQFVLNFLAAMQLRNDQTGVQQPCSGSRFAKMLLNMGWEHRDGKEWDVIATKEPEISKDVPGESTFSATGELPGLAPCPFCGFRLTYDEPGVFHPSGTGWKDNNGGFRSYHSFRDVPREQWCYEVNCDTTIGGCGANVSGDSPIEAVNAWNLRPVQVPVAVEKSSLRECTANGSSSCRYGPWGPRGQMQCEWCGELPPQFDVARQTDSVLPVTEKETFTGVLPIVGADENGCATLTWWKGTRRLTLYTVASPFEALLKSWGPNIDSEMRRVSVLDAQLVREAFQWLVVDVRAPDDRIVAGPTAREEL